MKLGRRHLIGAGLGATGLVVAGGLGAWHWQKGRRAVVQLVADGFGLLDLAGPAEILGRLPDANPVLASASGAPVVAATGPLALETARLASIDGADVIILNGGVRASPTQPEIGWLRSHSQRARAILALGEGRRWLEAAGLEPDGKRIVAAEGGAAALDESLRIAARLEGRSMAEALQLAIEYDPAPPFAAGPAVKLPGAPPMRIAILIYEGMTALDAFGPYAVLSMVPAITLDLVGVSGATVNNDMGNFYFRPNAVIGSAAEPDLILVPGGSIGTEWIKSDPRVKSWLMQHHASDRKIASVCTGALILAETGLLKGKPATTHWASQAALEAKGSRFEHARYLDQGSTLTAAGVSAGIDFALSLTGELYGKDVGTTIQAGIPYKPAPPFRSGALPLARQDVIDQARAILQHNALASAIRIKKRDWWGERQ
ncbi:DJ-1/PfpI family protein [Sphingorhabdus sp.]|uniref:DJ-1/PfpI family protein n=1 Tax=Sphingorhabdus sp. TaxID=1902408 RepID=UPI0037CC2FC0